MKIILKPDSYKGSLTATNAARIMKTAINQMNENIAIVMKPMVDGGEGTLATLLSATNEKKIPITCTGALGDSVETFYAITEGTTAIIEGANIAGLPQVPLHRRNPAHTTTFGIGEVMKDALAQGCTSFI